MVLLESPFTQRSDGRPWTYQHSENPNIKDLGQISWLSKIHLTIATLKPEACLG